MMGREEYCGSLIMNMHVSTRMNRWSGEPTRLKTQTHSRSQETIQIGPNSLVHVLRIFPIAALVRHKPDPHA